MDIIMPCFHGDEDDRMALPPPGIRDSLRPLSIPGQSKEQLGQHTAARFWRRPKLWKSMEIHGNPWEIRGKSMDNMDKSSWYDISRLYQSGNFGSVPHFSYTRMNHDIDQLVVHLVGTLSWRWMTLIGLLSCAVSVVLLSLFFSF